MLPLTKMIIISSGKNIWLFKFMHLFLILFIWKSFIKQLAVCCFLRSQMLVRVSRIILLASLSRRYFSSKRWLSNIVSNNWFHKIHPSNIYLVDNFLNIAYAKNWMFLVFNMASLRFFLIKPFSRKSWELVSSSKFDIRLNIIVTLRDLKRLLFIGH